MKKMAKMTALEFMYSRQIIIFEIDAMNDLPNYINHVDNMVISIIQRDGNQTVIF